MAAETTRIKDIPTTATTAAADDYVLLDGATNGTRKGLASNLITPAAADITDASASGITVLTGTPAQAREAIGVALTAPITDLAFVDVRLGNDGVPHAALDWGSYRKRPGYKYFVDPVNGSDANSGLTLALAKKTVASAITTYVAASPDATTSIGEIVLAPGVHYSSGGYHTSQRALSIVCDNGTAIIPSGKSGREAVVDTGSTYVWTSHVAAGVCDLAQKDFWGLPLRLTQAANLTACRATAGTWVVDSGNTYVTPHTGRSVDTSICSLMATAVGLRRVGGTYLKNVWLLGGYNAVLVSNTNNPFVAEECRFLFGLGGSNPDSATAHLHGPDFIALRNCEASGGTEDGFDYGPYGAFVGPHYVVEDGCRAFANGSSSGSDNGSTGHVDCRIIRLGGVYMGNKDRNVHDINTNKTWMVRCVAGHPYGATAATNVNYACGISGNAGGVMYLDGCKSVGATTDLWVEVAGSAIYTKNEPAGLTKTGSGTFGTY